MNQNLKIAKYMQNFAEGEGYNNMWNQIIYVYRRHQNSDLEIAGSNPVMVENKSFGTDEH